MFLSVNLSSVERNVMQPDADLPAVKADPFLFGDVDDATYMGYVVQPLAPEEPQRHFSLQLLVGGKHMGVVVRCKDGRRLRYIP